MRRTFCLFERRFPPPSTVERIPGGFPVARVTVGGVAAAWGIKHEKISASSQPEALKGPLAKFDGIGHAIPSERPELLIDCSFEF